MTHENQSVQIVSDYLEASMSNNQELAATFLASDVKIVFTGGREMPDNEAITRFNAGRYSDVQKRTTHYDWIDRGDHTVVYSLGTLYGHWPDGRPFAGNRFIDRLEVRNGKITRMDVWNDSAEWILDDSLNREHD